MRLAALLTIAITILAGCAESAPASAEAEDTEPIHSQPTVPTTTANVTTAASSARDHLLTIHPHAPVAGFVIDIPEGSAYAQFAGSSFTYVDVAFAPVVRAPPEGLGVFYFDMDTGELLGGRLMLPTEGTVWLTAALPTPVDEAADLSSWVARLPGELEGGSIGVVVAGMGVGQSLDVAMHVANERLDSFNLPAGLDILGGAPDAPSPHGTGTGFEAEFYIEIHLGLLGTPGLLGAVVTSGTPTLDERLPTWVPPHGGVRDAAVISDTTIESGWSYALTGYLAGEGVTQWHHSVTASGATDSDEGYLVWGDFYGLVASSLVFGLPIGVASGDGDGASAAMVDHQAVVDNELYLLATEAVAFDQPISELLGVKANPSAVLFKGLLGVDQADGTLSLGGEAPITHAGFLPTDPSA